MNRSEASPDRCTLHSWTLLN